MTQKEEGVDTHHFYWVKMVELAWIPRKSAGLEEHHRHHADDWLDHHFDLARDHRWPPPLVWLARSSTHHRSLHLEVMTVYDPSILGGLWHCHFEVLTRLGYPLDSALTLESATDVWRIPRSTLECYSCFSAFLEIR